jgi:hypothetical protein
MSGWTHITIESDQSRVEDEVNRELVEEQIEKLEKIKNRNTDKPVELLNEAVKELNYAQPAQSKQRRR